MESLMASEALVPATPSEFADNNVTALSLISYFRVFYPFMVFLSILSSGETAGLPGRCFNTEKGLSIDGSEYRRVRNIDHRGCALECRDDSSCLAYEWLESSELCYLKARSLSGDLIKKTDAVIGFCLDEDDETRDRFRDHEAHGPELAMINGVDGEDCKRACMVIQEAVIYSWTPDDVDDDEAAIGTCKCMESLRSIKLNFNSFSGFIGPRKWQTRKMRHSQLDTSRRSSAATS